MILNEVECYHKNYMPCPVFSKDNVGPLVLASGVYFAVAGYQFFYTKSYDYKVNKTLDYAFCSMMMATILWIYAK